jgi:hypothetical protein
MAQRPRQTSFSRLSVDFQAVISEHAYDSLLHLLAESEPALADVSGASPLIQGYLSRLTSSPLSSIVHERATLDEERKDLEHQLGRLAKREYHSFVSTASHGDAIASTFDGFEDKVSTVHAKIPSLDEAVAQFNAFSKSQVGKRGDRGLASWGGSTVLPLTVSTRRVPRKTRA